VALEEFEKQSFEEFTIDGDFSDVLIDTNEEIDGGAANDVKAWDKDGNEATSIVLDVGTLSVVDSTESGKTNAALRVLVKAGEQAKSKYKITFYGITNTTPAHKWEIDLKMKIKET
jgi:hypothetical protein